MSDVRELTNSDVPEQVETWKGKWIASQPRSVRFALVEAARRYWRERGFPFSQITEAKASHEASRLARQIWSQQPDSLIASRSPLGLSVANSYHPQMWFVRTYGRRRSPMDYFEDDLFLGRMLARAPSFWPNRSCWNAQCIRSLFRIAGPGRVANFRPMVAAGVIRRFSPRGGAVVDFCSGYGGRLLAAVCCNVSYFGIDASAAQIAGNQRLADDLNTLPDHQITLQQGCAIDVLGRMKNCFADLVFTSPPYFDKERYAYDELQSFSQFGSYEEWRLGFLATAVRRAFEVLKLGSHLVLNVSDSARFKLATDTISIMQSVFGNVTVLDLPMRRLPSYRHFQSSFRSEKIVVACRLGVKPARDLVWNDKEH